MSGFITGEQMRAARAMLRWEQAELAERARVSLKTIKRMEASTGRMESRSDYSVKKALEMGGIEFIESDDYHGRKGEGVCLQADRTAKLRATIVKAISQHMTYGLKHLVDDDPDFFEREAEDIIENVMAKSQEELRDALLSILNKR